MKRPYTLLLRLVTCLTMIAVLAGCAKGPHGPSGDASATPNQNIASQLLGCLIPEATEMEPLTTAHGFLRTAETLGYPAKLYHYTDADQAVQLVDQAQSEGCVGLLVWNPNEENQAAIARAAELGLAVIVPYHQAQGPGITANVHVDQSDYIEEVAYAIAQRMVERELSAGKLLIYGTDAQQSYDRYAAAIAESYPQYTSAYLARTSSDQTTAIADLAKYLLNNRDIKGLFCTDTDSTVIAVKARTQAQKEFKEMDPDAALSPVVPGATPIPEDLLSSITITVLGTGINQEIIKLMQSNDIYASVIEPYYEAGAQSTLLLDQSLQGEMIPSQSVVNMPIVRQDTLDKYQLIYEQVIEWFQIKQ